MSLSKQLLHWRYRIRTPVQGKMDKKILGVHTLITGKTGSGKSTLIQALAFKLLLRGEQVIVLDPHGQLAHDILKLSYPHTNKEALAYFNPDTSEYTPCFNPLYNQILDEKYIDAFANERSYVLSRVMGSSFSAQMETLLKPAICCILSAQGGSLNDLQQLFLLAENDVEFEKRIVHAPQAVQHFMRNGFHSSGYKTSKTGIVTRLQYLQNHAVLNQLLNGEPSFNLENLLRTKQCLLFNLSSSQLGMEVSALLGKMFIALILTYFFKRKKAFQASYLIIDEASILSDRSLEILLSQSRKWGLFVILATQDIRQFSKSVREHIETNIGLTLHSTMDMPNNTNKRYHFSLQYHGHQPLVIRSPKWTTKKRNGLKRNVAEVKQLKQFLYHSGAYANQHEHKNSDNYIRDQPHKSKNKPEPSGIRPLYERF